MVKEVTFPIPVHSALANYSSVRRPLAVEQVFRIQVLFSVVPGPAAACLGGPTS